MASTGKKVKKVKGKTLALTEFLGDTPALPPPAPRSKFNWADDEPEEMPAPAVQMYLPTAPRAARGNDIDESRIPKDGPWEAYIFNLPYDIEDIDIADFFRDLNVGAIRLPRDDSTGKQRGFGYVTFEDRNSYIAALQTTDTMLKGRRLRIEMADGNERGDRRGGMNRGRDRDRDRDSNYDPERTMGDWRSGPRVEATGPERPRREYTMRDGGDRDRDRDRDGFDGSSWRDAPRRPIDDRREDSGRGFGGPARRGYGDRRDAPSPPPDAKARPKLNLKPRTLPVDNTPSQESNDTAPNDSEGESRPATRSGANPFGAARPVDTSARERELAAKDPVPDTNGSDAREPRPPKPAAANPFGQAKPVDTSAREREIEENLRSRPERSERPERLVEQKPAEPPRPAKPSAASIFGGAKPVDTAQREREIEEKLSRTQITDQESKNDREKNDEVPEKTKDDNKVDAAPPVENAWAKRAQRSSPPRSGSEDRRSPDESRAQRSDEDKRDVDRRPTDSRPPPRDNDRQPGRGSDRDYSRRDRDHGRGPENLRDRDYSSRDYRRDDRYRDRRDNDDYSRRDGRDRPDDRYRRDDRDVRRDDRDRDYPRRDRDGRDYPRRDGDRRDDYRRDDRRDGDRRDNRDRDGRRDGDRRDDRDSRRDDRDSRRDDRDVRRDDDRDRDTRRDDRVSRPYDSKVDDSRRDDRRDDRDLNRRDREDDKDRRPDRDHRDADRKAPPPRTVDDRERGSKVGPRDVKDKPAREPRPPREMPKATDASAPNYAQPNKYSFLEEDTPVE